MKLFGFMFYGPCYLFASAALAFRIQAHHFKPEVTNTYPDIVFPVTAPAGHGTGFVVNYAGKFYVVTAAHVCAMSPILSYADQVAAPLVQDMLHDICILPWNKKAPARYFTLLNDTPIPFTKVEIFSRTDPRQEWTIPGRYLRTTQFKDEGMGMSYDSYQLTAVPVPGTSGGPVVLSGTRKVLCVATIVWFYVNEDGSPHYFMGECSSSLDVIQVFGKLK